MKVLKFLAQITCFALLILQFHTLLSDSFMGPRLFVGISLIITVLATFLYYIDSKHV